MSLQSSTPEALRVVNLLQERNLLPPSPIPAPTPCLPQDLQKINCHPEYAMETYYLQHVSIFILSHLIKLLTFKTDVTVNFSNLFKEDYEVHLLLHQCLR